jgi:hypothetical protein
MEPSSFMKRPYPECDKDDVPAIYGTETYAKPIAWLLEKCNTIEDWGCGYAYARKFVPEGRYFGVDGSPEAAPYADLIADLTTYKSDVDGIFIRHILEHNYNWRDVLMNATASFRKRLVLIMFTPFREHTVPLVRNDLLDLSFRKDDITEYFQGLDVREEHLDSPDTQYKTEHIFYVERAV